MSDGCCLTDELTLRLIWDLLHQSLGSAGSVAVTLMVGPLFFSVINLRVFFFI